MKKKAYIISIEKYRGEYDMLGEEESPKNIQSEEWTIYGTYEGGKCVAKIFPTKEEAKEELEALALGYYRAMCQEDWSEIITRRKQTMRVGKKFHNLISLTAVSRWNEKMWQVTLTIEGKMVQS